MKRIPQYTNIYTTNQKLFILKLPKIPYVGVDILLNFSDDGKVDYITLEGNIYNHKQVEIRNGITFMRMKKRFLASNEIREK